MSYLPKLPPYILGHRWHMPLGSGQVYCRYSGALGLRCLDLADVELPEDERGLGLFTSLLDDLEPICGPGNGIQALRVESVVNLRLAAFLRRRFYTELTSPADPLGLAPSFLYRGEP